MVGRCADYAWQSIREQSVSLSMQIWINGFTDWQKFTILQNQRQRNRLSKAIKNAPATITIIPAKSGETAPATTSVWTVESWVWRAV